MEHIYVEIMGIVGYNREKAEEKETICATKERCGGFWEFIDTSVVRMAREWLTCRELLQSRSGPFQEQLPSSGCYMQAQHGKTLKGHPGS